MCDNYCLSRTVDPTTIAAEMMIKFLIIYWPSTVNPNGKLVKHTSGKSISGKNVPGICINKSSIENLINGFMHIVTPIITSHQPKIGTKSAGSLNQ